MMVCSYEGCKLKPATPPTHGSPLEADYLTWTKYLSDEQLEHMDGINDGHQSGVAVS